jgi:hypothetical protein
MKISDDKQAFIGPKHCTRTVGNEDNVRDSNGCVRPRF